MGSWQANIIGEHPCFNRAASHWFTSVHLPVATKCNMRCFYCSRSYDCPNENPPYQASKVMTPAQALRKLGRMLNTDKRIRVAGIAGPGDALASEETWITLKKVHREFPQILKCVSTNGILLADKADDLVRFGVNTVSVTVNATDPAVALLIANWVCYRGEVYEGERGAEILVNNQLAGISAAAKRGIIVKVNSVLIPGINENHMPTIARTVKGLGACSMNITPLVPQAEFGFLQSPLDSQLYIARVATGAILRNMCNCLQEKAGLVGSGS